MTKLIALALIVLGAGLGALAAGAAVPSTQPATQPSSPPAQELTLDLGGNVTMKLVLIPAGKFMMGTPPDDKPYLAREHPQHEVTITQPFYMGVYEVTQQQYTQIVGQNPSHFRKPQNPVEKVSWNDAVDFCRKLSAQTGRTVRLPTEARWEYACRAGTSTRFSFGDSAGDLGDYAWYSANAASKTHPVGQKKPNAWGLYDMLGNVWEWCSDYEGASYEHVGKVDPTGQDHASEFRVFRGGSWQYGDCRSADRSGMTPDRQSSDYGFRVVVDLK